MSLTGPLANIVSFIFFFSLPSTSHHKKWQTFSVSVSLSNKWDTNGKNMNSKDNIWQSISKKSDYWCNCYTYKACFHHTKVCVAAKFPLYHLETHGTSIRQISEHLPRNPEKIPDFKCSLFPEELTCCVAYITCTKDSLHFRESYSEMFTARPRASESGEQPPKSSQWSPKTTPKKVTLPRASVQDTCGCLIALSAPKWSLGFLCQRNIFGPGKGKFC